jgi:CDP-diacylglycerol--serine O-phosphatidyltransferase
MNAEVSLFALKFKSWGWKGNEVRYGFLILSVALLVWLQFLAFPLIIVLYILFSLLARR